MGIAQLLQSSVSTEANGKTFTIEMRTMWEEVNLIKTFWPRQGEMIVVLLKGTATLCLVCLQGMSLFRL